jgi:hypothetical protein
METIWVLESIYQCTREDISDFLERLTITPTFTFADSINFGVLECWSNDQRIDVSFFNTPILHHSSTPLLRLSRTFGNFKLPFFGL